uniref:Papillosin n=1 Tax=Halocynthia papillosa TaxID=201963 RepID=PAPIL_HALPP|nr:RecName: Full=Papillosin [Halocynthia papillosa]
GFWKKVGSAAWGGVKAAAKGAAVGGLNALAKHIQ